MKNVTITEIAELAGVSMKTVSRVLNGEANVRPQTRDKVKDAAKTLNYKPNFSARSLASNRSYTVGHLYDNPNPDYLTEIYKGLHTACRETGYFAVMEPLSPPYADNALEYLNAFTVDGLILSPPLSDDVQLLDLLENRGVPYVRISPNDGLARSSYTGINDEAAMYDLTTYLLENGHTKFAFVSGPSDSGTSLRREAGYHRALKSAGLYPDKCPVYHGDFSVRSGTQAGEALLAGHKDITAILAANDDMAVGVMMAALKAGYDIPGDLSVCGFDGFRLGEAVWPQITTVSQPVREMALKATEILFTEIGPAVTKKRREIFDTTLLVRGSSQAR